MKFKILMAALLMVIAVAAQAQQPDGARRRGGDPMERAEKQTKMMVDSLALSTKQAEKVKEINAKYAEKQQQARNSAQEGEWETMRATMDSLRTAQDAELKSVLTKNQYEQWQGIAQRQFRNGGRGGYMKPGQQGPPPPPAEEKPLNKAKPKKSKKGTPPPPPPAPENTPAPAPAPAPEEGGGGN